VNEGLGTALTKRLYFTLAPNHVLITEQQYNNSVVNNKRIYMKVSKTIDIYFNN